MRTYTQVYHSTGSWAPLGIAAAAGRLLGLPQEVIRHAMGIGEYHAPITPTTKTSANPNMAKDAIGWGAMVGVASVLMAQKGFTGVEPLFADAPNPEIMRNLGTCWDILGLYFKVRRRAQEGG